MTVQSGKRQLQVFSQMIRMKFKPSSNIATTSIVEKNKQLIKQSSQSNLETDLSRTTMSRMTNRDKKLKYLISLSPEHFLVGNENQVDMIGILGIAYSFVDTDYCWSLSVTSGIDSLAVESKKCLIAIVSDKKLMFYRYSLKKSKEKPELIKEFEIKSEVKFIQFPKDSLLAIFYEKEFEIYNVEEHKKIYKKCLKSYKQPEKFVLFAVPQVVENSLKVFFIEEDEVNNKTFGLWYLKINLEFASIEIEKPQKVYDIKKNLKKMLVIQNFSKDIIFMNIGAQILAAKNGYILDSANVNIQSGHAKLKYISNQRLVHICDRKLEIYKMNILTNVVPNKIQVIPVDALEISDKPYEAEFFGIISTVDDNFAVFYQNISQFNIFTKGEATYWFALTQAMALQEKIRRIFNYGTDISNLNPEVLEQKCDMARKMGLNENELYLEIWNRSNKNSIEDYQFILATRNYKTIHSQIEKKLKKESMSFRELLKIEESCLTILKESIYSSGKCKQQNIQEYLTSHSFIKKLKLFRDIQLHRRSYRKSIIEIGSMKKLEEQENNKLLINIQQYYEYKDFDIKNYLVEKIVDFCIYGKDNKDIEIRMMLRTFKFIYRVIYKDILQQIIKHCKGKFTKLFKHIPQILPYPPKSQAELESNEEMSLYEGIWNDIKDYQWQRNLFVQNITTIDNKQHIQDFINSIWYRRYWLTAHQLINLSKQKILQINRENNSELIFYFFISKIFDLIPDQQTQYQIIYFLEEHYTSIPQHLKGKIFLQVNLHKFYVENHNKAKLQPLRLDQFLNMNDAQLFEYFFIQEKHTKNCILKSIKKIYEETCQEGQGLILFNEGLLAYFKSPLSQISDLKYLLNRMNNEKTQFHQANLSTYQVLIRAMEYKLKLGSQQDIPIDQVLIYIENIPISKGNQIMEELQIVEKINQQADRFKKMKINMTIKEIIDNFQDVISRVVEYEFEVNKIKTLRKEKDITEKTYKILAEVQAVKQKIYGHQRNPGLPFFIYLTKLLQEIQLIKCAKNLLTNQFITKYYPVDLVMTENLVIYMYKWIFSQQPAFLKNSDYIRELMTLLPEDNDNRKFIQNQIAFAIALSTPQVPLQYPISIDSQYPGLFELADVLKLLPIQHIVTVDIDFIYHCMKEMQEITIRSSYNQDEIDFITIQKITPHQVYSVFILKIIEENHLNAVIPLIRKILSFNIPNKRYNMIFFVLLIEKLSPQLNDESKSVLIKVISYCYDEPQIIFGFIEHYFHSKETALMKGVNLKKKLEKYIKGKKNYFKDNPLFSAESKYSLKHPQMQDKFTAIIEQFGKNLRNTKLEFHTIELEILFSIICNQPYLAAKFIQANQYKLNFKVMRAYLSYFVGNPIFDDTNFIDFCKKIFAMVLQSNIKRTDISRIIFNEEKFHFNYLEIKEIGIGDEIDKKIEKTYKNFEKKKRSLINMHSKKQSASENGSQHQQIQLQIRNSDELSSKTPSEYPFSDSDDDLPEEEVVSNSKAGVKKRSGQLKNSFNSKDERAKVMGRKNSLFGEKSSCQLSRSRDSSFDPTELQEQVSNQNNAIKSVSLKVPDVKKPVKIYVKRTPTVDNSVSVPKKSVSIISQKDESCISPSKITKIQKIENRMESIQKKQSLVFGQNKQNSKMSKQQSQYSMNEISEVQEQDAIYRIKKLIVQTYDPTTDKIDFEGLAKQETQEEFVGYLREVINKIYMDKSLENKLKLRLIRLITQKYAKFPVNLMYLAVYQNVQKLEEKYSLSLPIDRMLPAQGLFMQSKTLDDLFNLILPKIIQISTDQTIFKLSKLISLSFRKNVYQAEISFEYMRKMIDQFSQGHSEVQLNMRMEIMKSLLSKMSIMSLKEKAPKLIQGIFANPGLIQQIISAVVESVRKRGDASAANEIKKLMEK